MGLLQLLYRGWEMGGKMVFRGGGTQIWSKPKGGIYFYQRVEEK